jgi:serine/threonine protein phosphatase PrpC
VSAARYYLDSDMQAAEEAAVAGGRLVCFSSRSPAKTTANEDAAAVLVISDASCVVAVADGVGGGAEGQRASGLAVKHLATAIESAPAGDLLRTALLNGLESANREIMALGTGAATTLAAVEIQSGAGAVTVRPYHVGDTEILIVGQRGSIKFQTVSHAPVAYAVEAGVLDESEALHHDERHIVSNTLGDAGMRIEIGPEIALARRDTLLVATDGLIDNLYLAEIIETIRKGPLAQAARRLAESCRRRMTEPQPGLPSKPDDLTFALFRRA